MKDTFCKGLGKDKKCENNLSSFNLNSDKAIRLQREIRNQSNQQMNNMLRKMNR